MQILPLTLVPPVRPASPPRGSSGSGSRPGSSAGSSGGGAAQRPASPAGAASSTAAGGAAAAAAGQAAPAAPERAAAMICSLLLPDSRASWGELGAGAATLGSALGYLVLLLDLLSRLLQLPLPHSRCAFQGSTSRLWQPDSFWDMRAGPPADALLLAWPKAAAEGHHDWGASLAAMGGGGAAAAAAQARARAEQQLRAALHTLARGAGALVFARLGPEAPLKVPPDWSPFAWLAGLCKVLASEGGGPPRPPSARVAVPSGAAQPLAASGVFGRYSPEAGSMAQSVLLFPGGCCCLCVLGGQSGNAHSASWAGCCCAASAPQALHPAPCSSAMQTAAMRGRRRIGSTCRGRHTA